MKTLRLTLSLGAVLALAASATAQPLIFTFDTGTQNFQNFAWTPTAPVGWSGGASIQAPSTVGGWTLGGSFNYRHEFDWASGEQPIMQSLAASGNGAVSFDIMVDGTSFNPAAGVWFTILVAGNSGGAHQWTQAEAVSGGWHSADDPTLYSWHVTKTFADLGWDVEDGTGGWFQMYFGSNSDAAQPVKFYVDNVMAYAVPEPSTFALVGLGAAALLMFRRRN